MGDERRTDIRRDSKPAKPDLTVPPREFRVTKRQALGKQKHGQLRPMKANP